MERLKCLISMKGSVMTGDIEVDEDHMALTDTIDAFKYGKINCIILATGHAVYWILKVTKDLVWRGAPVGLLWKLVILVNLQIRMF